MADPIVYRLSSIDQSVVRTYIRCTLCYPRSDDGASVADITSRLEASLKRTLQHFPILAGQVVSADSIVSLPTSSGVQAGQKSRRESTESFSSNYHGHHGRQSSDANPFAVLRKDRRASGGSRYGDEQRGRLEVHLTMEQLEKFKPIVTDSENLGSYAELKAEGMPAVAFVGSDSIATPLPDLPDPAQGSNHVFAVQATFIEGGLLVSLYLHHSVSDIHGLSKVISYMSNDASSSQPTVKALEDSAWDEAKARDGLSGCRGFKADAASHPEYDAPKGRSRRMSTTLGAASDGTAKAISIDLNMIHSVHEMVLDRLGTASAPPSARPTPFDCLIALIWKAVIRARWIHESTEEGKSSMLLLPVNIAKKVEPHLHDTYLGNACLFSNTKGLRIRLMLPFDVGSIAETATLVHQSIANVDEMKVRSSIALINELADVRGANHPSIDLEQDVLISDWTHMPTGNGTNLGLGLGAAEFIRKPSRQQSSFGCIVLPQNAEKGVWKVLVQMDDDTMSRMLEDPGFEPFVVSSA